MSTPPVPCPGARERRNTSPSSRTSPQSPSQLATSPLSEATATPIRGTRSTSASLLYQCTLPLACLCTQCCGQNVFVLRDMSGAPIDVDMQSNTIRAQVEWQRGDGTEQGCAWRLLPTQSTRISISSNEGKYVSARPSGQVTYIAVCKRYEMFNIECAQLPLPTTEQVGSLERDTEHLSTLFDDPSRPRAAGSSGEGRSQSFSFEMLLGGRRTDDVNPTLSMPALPLPPSSAASSSSSGSPSAEDGSTMPPALRVLLRTRHRTYLAARMVLSESDSHPEQGEAMLFCSNPSSEADLRECAFTIHPLPIGISKGPHHTTVSCLLRAPWGAYVYRTDNEEVRWIRCCDVTSYAHAIQLAWNVSNIPGTIALYHVRSGQYLQANGGVLSLHPLLSNACNFSTRLYRHRCDTRPVHSMLRTTAHILNAPLAADRVLYMSLLSSSKLLVTVRNEKLSCVPRKTGATPADSIFEFERLDDSVLVQSLRSSASLRGALAMIGSPSASVPKLTQVHRSGEARERQAQVSHHDPLGELCATLQMVIDFDFSSINTSVTCSALETSLALLEATGGKLKKLLWMLADSVQEKHEAHTNLCEICFERLKEVVLVPCGHRFCSDCAKSLEQCPSCRVAIAQYVKVF